MLTDEPLEWGLREPHSLPDDFLVLARRLVIYGGVRVVVPPGENVSMLPALLERGAIQDYPVEMVPMERSACHENAVRYAIEHSPQTNRIATGFALSDSLWRHHSWVHVTEEGGRVHLIETTVPRAVYFGITLQSRDEVLAFVRSIGLA